MLLLTKIGIFIENLPDDSYFKLFIINPLFFIITCIIVIIIVITKVLNEDI
jgi:hypothetical protein